MDSARLQLALIQMNSHANALQENVARACAFVAEAGASGAELVVLPEFFNTEYFCQYWDFQYFAYAEPADGYTLSAMRQAARQAGVYLVATIYERAGADHLYDTAFLIDPAGEIFGRYRKVHPSAIGSLEKIYFRPGSHFPVFKLKDWTVGVNICYDNWFPESGRCVALQGAELILAPFATPSPEPWDVVLRTRAIDNEVYLAACNHVGPEGEWVMSGQSIIIDPRGEVLARANGVDETIISATLERGAVRAARRRRPFWRDRVRDAYRAICTPADEIIPDVGGYSHV